MYVSDALSDFETFVRSLKQQLEMIWDNFPQVQLTKLSRVLEFSFKSLTRVYVKGDGRHIEHFLYSKKRLHLRSLRCETTFDNVLTVKLPIAMSKSRVISSVL